MTDLDQRAKALYEAAPSRPWSPPWEQLGDVTRAVWRQRAQAEEFGDLA